MGWQAAAGDRRGIDGEAQEIVGMSQTPNYNDLNVPMIAVVGVMACIITLATVLGFHVLYYRAEKQQTLEKVVRAESAEAGNLLANQQAKLARYGWLNREQGQVAIPIERAMDIVVKELAGESAEH